MNKEQQELYPRLFKIIELSGYVTSNQFEKLFPNTIFTEKSGLPRMASCIGFIRGMAAAGKLEEANDLAVSLFNAFNLGMSDAREQVEGYEENPETLWPQRQKLVVNDDGTFLGFSFCLYGVTTSQQSTQHACKFPSRSSPYSQDAYYARAFNGGILFHGLGEVFAVTMSRTVGWQMHT